MRSLLIVFLLVATAGVARADDAIAFSEQGLRVGAKVIYAKPVDAAAYDPALDLVWFTSKGMLQVIDLRDAKHKPIVIAKKFPKVGFWIDGFSKAEYNSAYTAAYASLTVAKKSKITAQEGAYGPVDQDSTDKLKKQIKKAKLVGGKWLAKLGKRTVRSVTIPTPSLQAKVTLPADMCQADEPDSCGEATSFGLTKLQLVVTEYSCGDACYQSCVLYDPATKKFANPSPTDEPTAWDKTATAGACDGYWFDSNGTTYYQGSLRCTLDKTLTCTIDLPWSYIGVAQPSA